MYLAGAKKLIVGMPEGGFTVCSSSRHSDGSLIYVNLPSPPVTPIFSQRQVHSRHQPSISRDLEFIADRVDNLSPSPEESDSSTVVRGMTHNGAPLQHAILEESPSKDDLASSEGERSGSPLLRTCNTVIFAVPIATMLPPEETLVFQTLQTRPQRTATPTPSPCNQRGTRGNDDMPRRTTSNEKPHDDEMSSSTNRWLLRPG
jgi:hypothetical protein